MSLYDSEKSIIGRSVVVHEYEDTGEPPFGLAGEPIAAGAIGIGNPGSDDNGATAPTNPAVTKVMCYLRGDFDGPVTLNKKILSTNATLSATLTLAAISTAINHSFHFHEFGDINNSGPVWQASSIEVRCYCCSWRVLQGKRAQSVTALTTGYHFTCPSRRNRDRFLYLV